MIKSRETVIAVATNLAVKLFFYWVQLWATFYMQNSPSYAVLTLLTNKPHSVNILTSIFRKVTELYHTLNKGLELIQAAMKLFRTWKLNTDILVD